MTAADFGVVRIPLLSVEEAAALVSRDSTGDALIATAVDLAWSAPGDGSTYRPHATTMRYVARMGGRATPFGLLAGAASVDVAEHRRLLIGRREEHSVLVRVDFDVLQRLVNEALDQADLERVPIRRNRSLRRVVDGLRYIKPGDGAADVVTTRATPAIIAVLDAVGDKTMLVGEVLDVLEAQFPMTPRDSLRGFVERLIGTDLVHRAVDLLSPGEEPVDLALAILDRIGDRDRFDLLSALCGDACGVQPVDPALGRRLDEAWRPLATAFPRLADTPPNRRFHLETNLATGGATVDRRTVRDLTDTLRRLEPMFGTPTYLAEFRDSFRTRYEDAEVPLLEAVDVESGVLRSLDREVSPLAEQAGVRPPERQHAPRVAPELLAILDRWIGGERTVDIGDLPVAPSCTARGMIAALLDNHEGRFHSMLYAGYQRTSLALVGRLVFGREATMRRARAWMDAEAEPTGAQPEPIHAELVYSPGTRISNVLLRPRVFDDEIALDGGGDGSIPLDRLMVRLDGDTVRLRDSSTGRDVIVEMNTAHNVIARSLNPIYNFLGMLVSPGAIGWSWGALRRLSHLPRVACGPVIVAPESWHLPGAVIKEIVSSRDPGRELRRRLDGLGERRWVGVGEDDRQFPIDLGSRRSIELGLGRSTGQERVELVELPHLESPAATGPTGRHVAELAMPLRRSKPPRPRTRPPAAFDPAAGGAWVYFKYYCGSSSADTVVRHASDLAAELTDARLVTDWFFLRYADDGFHVRVRMRPVGAAERSAVLAAMDGLGRRLQESGLVGRAVMDVYVPEVARYGGPEALRHAEALFTADSRAVAEFLVDRPAEDVRLFRCVADTLHWSSTVFLSPDDRREFIRRCHRGLGLEYEKTGNRRGAFFRGNRADLDAYLETVRPAPAVTRAVADLAATVRAADPDRGAVFSVLGSALHLHSNRMFSVDPRRLEFITYDLAHRKMLERHARAGQ